VKPTTPLITRPYFFAVVFFALFLFLLYQLMHLIAPFLSALLWAAILTLALYPIHKRILRMVKDRKDLAAACTTLLAVLLVIVPAIFLLSICVSQAIALYDWTSGEIQSGRLMELWDNLLSTLSQKIKQHPAFITIDIRDVIVKSVGDVSSILASQIGAFLKNTLILAVNLLVMLISLFFLLKNGESYYQAFLDMLPFASEHKHSISKKIHGTFTAVLYGVFLIAVMQGVLTGIGFALFGVPYAVFWGFLAIVLAILPVGGTALVWIPGAIYLFLVNGPLPGILLGLWGFILVSLPDNFLKPLIIGKKANIPTFFLFISILGGLYVYGILGVLFGPLIITLITAFVEIYKTEYLHQPDTEETEK